MKLYNYFRSSAAYRVRIALNMKGIKPENVFVHLQKSEQLAAGYLQINPQGLVPTLVDGDEVITQSLAIIEYLDETHPVPPLLPATPAERARVRSIALAIACDIHPIDNLRVLKYLTGVLKVSEEQKNAWYAHWVREGLSALETRLAADARTGRCCHGDSPTLADICLIPQLANARRVTLDLAVFPTLLRIEEACNALPAFADAAPARQPDAA
ncbi:MAG: maleylacetoacetate isomerase [Betaproteobacteria bacterium]|nr:maleylacetoacetate isomerase [Betaproteobacteria bacterium]